ncbi:MAG TPA: peptidoglycan endopeptidase [Ignavibacteria bacterium]|nr:peptidoglycan endopeptidase [Ignavibacteria bacterium]
MRIYLKCEKLFIFIIIFFLFNISCKSQSDEIKNKYAIAFINTPVLNTSDFESVFGGNSGTEVKLDSKGLIREMEFIAFPNTAFEILETIPKDGYNIYRIATNDYQYNSADLFIDSRFVHILDSIPSDRIITMPSKEIIIEKMNSLEGFQYMWGGNCGDGIEQLIEFYKPATELQNSTKDLWTLKGVDCSGLIYESTGGATPRNTSSLINYGEGVDIAGMNAKQISEIVKPLDLIVWSGHVIIVLDENTVIESTPDLGVHKSDLLSRLKSVIKERTPVNDWGSSNGKKFVVRRWI